jgi:hypothetical protein
MKISRHQLRRIILETVSKQLHAKESTYGGMYVETGAGEHVSIGEMVAALIDAGDTDIFNDPQGVDTVSLDRMLQQDGGGVQGGMERWDSDVFPQYYNVNLVKVVNRYASLIGLDITWLGEDDDMPSDTAWNKQNTPPEPEYEDDGTNEFEERYS